MPSARKMEGTTPRLLLQSGWQISDTKTPMEGWVAHTCGRGQTSGRGLEGKGSDLMVVFIKPPIFLLI